MVHGSSIFSLGFHPIYRRDSAAFSTRGGPSSHHHAIAIDTRWRRCFWSWGGDDDIIADLVKKKLFVGVFAYSSHGTTFSPPVSSAKLFPALA